MKDVYKTIYCVADVMSSSDDQVVFLQFREVSRVREELQRVNAQLESARSELADVEARSREREGEVEGSLTHMQQELTKRAQQVGL